MITHTKAVFLEKISRTKDVVSFRFKTSEKILFMPGQFAQVIFDQADKHNNQLNKYLSFSSSPDNDYMEFTKKISGSEFSAKLLGLQENDAVLIKGPLGNCSFKEEYKKIGFLIGGIGITPVMSILEYIAEHKLDTDVYLLYSNRTENDIAFREQIDAYSRGSGHIRAVYIITDCQPQDALCLFGSIDQSMLREHVDDIGERIFYIFGPPGMVLAMRRVCAKVGCEEEQVKSENFVGY